MEIFEIFFMKAISYLKKWFCQELLIFTYHICQH